MTDIILGMGEVGETLFDLLVDRKFDCIGIDLEDSKCKNYTENKIIENPPVSAEWHLRVGWILRIK